MDIKVRGYGLLADVIGSHEIQVNGVQDTDSLHKYLLAQYKELGSRQFVMAVKNKIIKEAHELSDGDVIALLPPFSGG